MKNSIRLTLFFFLFGISPILCFAIEITQFINVKTYGAIGDGKNLDSKAINIAIEAALKAGGGTVYVPVGNYLCGSIHLMNCENSLRSCRRDELSRVK